MKTCTTCTRLANLPYRRLIEGRIVEGCVDGCHGAHLEPGSADHAWHNRPEAEQCRSGVYAGRLRPLPRVAAAMVRRQNKIEQARGRIAESARTALYWAKDARRGFARGNVEHGLQSLEIARQDRNIARSWRAELARLEAT